MKGSFQHCRLKIGPSSVLWTFDLKIQFPEILSVALKESFQNRGLNSSFKLVGVSTELDYDSKLEVARTVTDKGRLTIQRKMGLVSKTHARTFISVP